jgi:archaellum component FlaC
MAAITLKKSKFDSFGDMLDGLLSKLGSYDATVKDLKNTVASVGCENDNQVSSDLGNAIDDIVNSEESKEEKKEKINALKQKIETFVNNAVQHEKAAADKIKEKKERILQEL